jgi:hypothetical protein
MRTGHPTRYISSAVLMRFRKFAVWAAGISSSLRLPNATRDYIGVYEQFFARLSAKYFSPCFSLCLLD